MSNTNDLDNLTQELNALCLLGLFLSNSINWIHSSDLFVNTSDRGLMSYILAARSACNSIASDYDLKLRSYVDESEVVK